MNRKQRAERKRKKRQERLRRERHERHFVAPVEISEDEELSEEDEREEAAGTSPFLWESTLRHARRNLAIGALFESGVRYVVPTVDHTEHPEQDPDDHEHLWAHVQHVASSNRDPDTSTHEFARVLFPIERASAAALERRVEILESFIDREAATASHTLGSSESPIVERSEYKRRTLTLARHALADAHSPTRLDDAVATLRAALELDAADELRTRARLVGQLLLHRDLEAARAVIRDSTRPEGGAMLWASVLERFLAGRHLDAAVALKRARQLAPQIEAFLVPLDEDMMFPEQSLDEMEFLVGIGPAWKANPAVTEWLGDGGRAPSDEERQRAIASYVAPLDRLLGLGPVEFSKHLIDYQAHGLASEHAGELVRMMVDRALHFSTQDSAVVWAPLHALRALAQMKATEAIEPLLRWCCQDDVDDWFLDEMPEAMARIGAPAVQPLLAMARDQSASFDARTTAFVALEKVIERDPAHAPTVLDEVRATLRQHLAEPTEMVGFLVGMLSWNGTAADIPLVEAVFDAGVDDLESGSRDRCIAQLRSRGGPGGT